MKQFFERAVANITTYGDTDIFPFPIENLVLYDKAADAIDLLLDIDNNFRNRLAETPPSNYSALTPVAPPSSRMAQLGPSKKRTDLNGRSSGQGDNLPDRAD